MGAKCRSKILQNAPLFCTTFDLHYAIIGLEKTIFWSFLSDLLRQVLCIQLSLMGIQFEKNKKIIFSTDRPIPVKQGREGETKIFLWLALASPSDYFEFWPMVSEEKIFQISVTAISHAPWQPCFWTDCLCFSYCCRGPLKEHSCEVWLKLA